MQKRILNKETIEHIGKNVKVCGWVNTIRAHGKIIFIDLRDRSGILQLVCQSIIAGTIRPEWVISVEGIIKERPKGMQNPKFQAGKIELKVENLEILNKSKTPPFEISADTKNVNEETRLKYRYLDLRTKRMRENLIFRYKVIKYIRNFMDKNNFIEIETPLLTKSTPEGARDFVVPSRLHPKKFYALPQSPQQYKQLLMVAGFEKYFQIVKCLRDEDPRADRQTEHTQLDIEMSFVKQKDILNIIEKLYISLVEKLLPKKKITKIPFPCLKYEEVMKKYGTDRPDIRKDKVSPSELGFCWVINFPMFEWHKKDKKWGAMHHPFTQPQIKNITKIKKEPEKVLAHQYDLVLNGQEVGGGSIRTINLDILTAIFEVLGHKKSEIKKQFNNYFEAFKYGVPPHGGIALGIDRLLATVLNEPSIREVMAFPKTGDGQDPMMNAPSEISKEQLKELQVDFRSQQSQKK